MTGREADDAEEEEEEEEDAAAAVGVCIGAVGDEYVEVDDDVAMRVGEFERDRFLVVQAPPPPPPSDRLFSQSILERLNGFASTDGRSVTVVEAPARVDCTAAVTCAR